MNEEERLIQKLGAIEALFAGATTPGERGAAAGARERIAARLEALRAQDPPIEYRFTVGDDYGRRVLIALLRRYGIAPFRYPRQKRQTIMARVPVRFVNETLWPEFEQIMGELRRHLEAITQRVIATAVHADASDAAETAPALLDAAASPPEDEA